MTTSGAPVGLARALGRWDLVALVLNGIVGAGIFGLPAKVHALLGAWGIAAIAVCALIMTLVILCFAEVSSRFADTGGPYLYVREALGPFAGFETGWLLWVARLTGICVIGNLMVQYLGFLDPALGTGTPRTLILAGTYLALTVLHITGVKRAALVGNVITIAKLLPLLVFVVVGLGAVEPQRIDFSVVPSNASFSNAVLLLGFAFVGWETAVVAAGELRDPRRDTPFALLVSVALVAALYVGIQVVCVGTLPDLSNSARPVADASRTFLGTAGATAIVAGAVVSMLGTLNGGMLTVSRLPFAMAEQGQLPAWLARVHPRYQTPVPAILLSAAIILALTLTSTYVYVLTVSTIARLLVFAATCVALPILRRPALNRPALFTLRGGMTIPVLALLFIAWLLLSSSLKETRDVLLCAAAGSLLFAWSRRTASRPSAAGVTVPESSASSPER